MVPHLSKCTWVDPSVRTFAEAEKTANVMEHDEQHRCMGLNSHGVSKVSVIDAAGVKQVEQ